MTKTDVIQTIDGKMASARASIGIAYILGSRAWVSTFRSYIGPGEISIRSGQNDHVFTIQDPQVLVARYQDARVVNDDALNVMRLGVTEAIDRKSVV